MRLSRWSPRVNAWIDRLAKPFDQHLSLNPPRTIFISKFIYGLHRTIILRSGMLKIPLSKFLKADVPAAILWIGIVGGVGYATGISSLLFKRYLPIAEIVLFLGLVGFLVFVRLVSQFLKKEL